MINLRKKSTTVQGTLFINWSNLFTPAVIDDVMSQSELPWSQYFINFPSSASINVLKYDLVLCLLHMFFLLNFHLAFSVNTVMLLY